MKRKMRRVLATLLAFTLTFSFASTDVLATGVNAEQGAVIEEAAGESESAATSEGVTTPGLRAKSLLKSSSLSGTIFSVGFDGGIPEDWTQEGDTEWCCWTMKNGAAFFQPIKSTDEETTWLITPVCDFSDVGGTLKMSFEYRQDELSNRYEELCVCYRVDGGEWQELFKSARGADKWVKQIMILPEGAKSANVEIGFRGVNHNAFGIYVKTVVLEVVESVQTHSLTYVANGGSGSMTDQNNPYGEGSTVIVMQNAFQAPAGKAFYQWNTMADGKGMNWKPGEIMRITDDVTLYAQWKSIYDVTYDANGGSGNMTDPKNPYFSGEKYSVLHNGYSAPAGKKFDSWNTKADGSGATYFPDDKIMVSGDVTLYAQWRMPSAILDEDFEGASFPQGWTREDGENNYYWTVGTGDYYTQTGAHSGNKNALIKHKKSGAVARLITPELDLSNMIGKPTLSFWFINSKDVSQCDRFSVYYRVKGSEWKQLFSAEDEHNKWTKITLSLPYETKSPDVQIGFVALDRNGDGIGLDDILMEDGEEVKTYAVTYDANGGHGMMTDYESPYFAKVLVKILHNEFKAPDGKVFSSWNTKADGSGTKYSPGNVFEITDDVTLYARWREPMDSLDEGFEEGAIPESWAVTRSDEAYQWTVGTGNDGLLTSAYSGNQNAFITYVAGAWKEESWLISPALDLRGLSGIPSLSFWYFNRKDEKSPIVDKFGAYYRIDGGEWEELYFTEAVHQTWTKKTLFLPEETKAGNLEIGFRVIGFGGAGVGLDEVRLRVTDEVHPITIASGMVNGTVVADQSCAEAGDVVTVSILPDDAYVLKTLSVKKGSQSISLTKENASNYTFVMPDGEVSVTATFQAPDVTFFENFDEELSGWIFVDADNDSRGWGVKTWYNVDTLGNPNCHSGLQSLISASRIDGPGALEPNNWALTPAITIPEHATLSFWIKAVDPLRVGDKLAVYVGEGTDVSTMTKIGGDYVSTDKFVQYEVDLSAYAGKTVCIAFRHYNSCDFFQLSLDDVMVRGEGEGSEYSVSYDANGGNGEMTDPKSPYTSGLTAKVFACDFTAPSGAEFMGWNTKADGSGTLYNVGDVMAISADVTLYAQWAKPSDLVTFLEEDFEDGEIPTGWTADSNADGYGWKITKTIFLGNYKVTIPPKRIGSVGWLITPKLNLSGISGAAKLGFYYENEELISVADELAVYYRVADGAWTQLFLTKTAHEMNYQEIFLPQEAKAAKVEFGFKAVDCYGKGVGVDEISIKGIGEIISSFCSVTYDANGGSDEMVDANSPYEKGDVASVMTNLFTAPQGKSFASWNTKADGSGTTYLPGSTFKVKNDMTLYAQWKSVSSMPTRLTEGFEGIGIPEGWKSVGQNYHWTVGKGDRAEITGAHSGAKNALINHVAQGMTAWLITPELDLRNGADYVLSFWYVNGKWSSGVDSLKVCYRVNGGEWAELFDAAQAHVNWTKQEIKIPEEARQAGVEFGFCATDGMGFGIGLDDVEVRQFGNPVCKVTVEEAEHGTVDVGEHYAEIGQSFSVNYAPASGYRLAEINLDASGTYPQIYETCDGHYAFDMPECDVTVSVQFVPVSDICQYDLWVTGMRVTSANASDVLGDGAASYDGITNTLKLNKDITCENGDAISSMIDGLVIKTTAPLTITSTADNGMQLLAGTVIETKGMLTINGSAANGGYGIYGMSNDVVIRNAQITVSGKWGIYGENGPITIQDSFVMVSGTEGAAQKVSLTQCKIVFPEGAVYTSKSAIYDDNFYVAKKATICPVKEVTKENPYVEGFEESGLPFGWMFADADGDGQGWYAYSEANAVTHGGVGVLTSASYDEDGYVLNPDNWAFTPALKLSENAVLSFWIAAQFPNRTNDKMAVYVGRSPNPDKMTRLGGDYVTTAEHVDYQLDLSDYAGQVVFIGFRHYNVSNKYRLNLDDVKVSVKTENNLEVTFKHNIEFDNNIAMHYIVPQSELQGYLNLKLVIDKEVYAEGVATPTIQRYMLENPTPYEVNGVDYWHFTFPGISASEMGNALSAKVVCEKNGVTYESQADVYTVKDYAYGRLAKTSSTSYKKVLVDMLNYGAAAQAHFKKNAANPVNAGLTDAQKAFGTSLEGFSVKSAEKVISLEGGATTAFDAKNLVFGSNVELVYRMDFSNFKTDAPAGTTEDQKMANVKVVFKYNNGKGEKTLTVPYSKFTTNGGKYVASCSVLTPAEMGCTVNATIYDGDVPVSDTLQYGIESYVYNRLSGTGSSSETFKELLKRMVLYGRAVNEHF